MSATPEQLAAAVDRIVINDAKFHAMTQGGAADPDVPTENGPVPPVAKVLAQYQAHYQDGTGADTPTRRKNWRTNIRAKTRRRYVYGPNLGGRALKSALDNNLDCNILALTDSTGDVVNSWLYKIAEKVAAQTPASRRVEHRKINAAAPATKYGWLDPTIVKAGTDGERYIRFPSNRVVAITSMVGNGAYILVNAPNHGFGVTEAITVAGNSIAGYNLFYDSYSVTGHVSEVVDANTFKINSTLNLGVGNGGTATTAPRWGMTCNSRTARGGLNGWNGTSRLRMEVEIIPRELNAGNLKGNFDFGFTAANQPTYLRIGTGGTLGSIFHRYPVMQVETLTVVGQVTTAGDLKVIVTAAGMTGNPITFTIPVKLHETELDVAQRIRSALNANANLTALYVVSGSDDKVILTRKNRGATDGTLNIEIGAAGTTAIGITAGNSANTVAGHDHDYQFPAGSAAFPALVVGTKIRFAVEIQANNGAGQSVITYQRSSDGGATWTTITTTNATAGVNGIGWLYPNITQTDYVYFLNSGGGIPCPGVDVTWAQIFVGEDKEPILPIFDLTHWVHGTAQQRNIGKLQGAPTFRVNVASLSGQGISSWANKTYGIQPLYPSRSKWLAEGNYQMVFISTNMNDVGENRATKIQKLREVISYFCFAEATPPVIYIHTQNLVVETELVSPLGKITNDRLPWMIEIGSHIPGITILDSQQAMRDYLAEGLGPVTDLLMPQPAGGSDVHPDNDGYDLMAEVAIKELILENNEDYFEHTNYA